MFRIDIAVKNIISLQKALVMKTEKKNTTRIQLEPTAEEQNTTP